MIYRRVQGAYALIPQAQIAELAAGLVSHLGKNFSPANHPADVVEALHLAESGFDLLDDTPPITADGRPMPFTQLSMTSLLNAWSQSSEQASHASNPYVQLLVSVQSLQRSGTFLPRNHTTREIFELNRMQQLEIVRQEQLRPALGLRNDIPMRCGLPDTTLLTETEQRFFYDCRLLSLLWQIALEASAHARTSGEFGAFAPRPAAATLIVRCQWLPAQQLTLTPWPFTSAQLPLSVSGKLVPSHMYDHEKVLHEAMDHASEVTIEAVLCESNTDSAR